MVSRTLEKEINMTMNLKYLRPKAAANYLGLATSTLAKMRLRGDGPAFMKAGPRAVLYHIDSLNDWLNARVYQNTSQYGSGV